MATFVFIDNIAGIGEMPVTSIFSVSHNVFKRPLRHGCKNQGLLGKGLKKGTCAWL